MYLVRCSACSETELYEDLSEAQDCFNEHAVATHPVELRRIDANANNDNAGN